MVYLIIYFWSIRWIPHVMLYKPQEGVTYYTVIVFIAVTIHYYKRNSETRIIFRNRDTIVFKCFSNFCIFFGHRTGNPCTINSFHYWEKCRYKSSCTPSHYNFILFVSVKFNWTPVRCYN